MVPIRTQPDVEMIGFGVAVYGLRQNLCDCATLLRQTCMKPPLSVFVCLEQTSILSISTKDVSIFNEKRSIDTHSGPSVATPSKHGSTLCNRIHQRHSCRRFQDLQRCVSSNIELERRPKFVAQYRLGNGCPQCLPCPAEAVPFEKRNCTKV